MIQTQQLIRQFGDQLVVNRLNLSIEAGELYGFLGMNGAGKTTTINMLVGLLKPTSGSASICGYDIQQDPMLVKRRFGYLAQSPFLYGQLTGREFLYFLGGLHRVDSRQIERRSNELLTRLNLADKADDLIGSYSGGMQRKIALCGALLHEPEVLILDEPFAGLDPLSARHVKDMLAELRNAGRTIFMSTHTLEIAERVCTRLGVIHNGQLIAEGTLSALRGDEADATLEELFVELAADADTAQGIAQL